MRIISRNYLKILPLILFNYTVFSQEIIPIPARSLPQQDLNIANKQNTSENAGLDKELKKNQLAKQGAIQKDTIKVEAVPKQTNKALEKLLTQAQPKLKDSIIYIATDDDQTRRLDAKWKQELYAMQLYDTVYKSVTEMDYEPVVFAELPTDTLKFRLDELDARTPFNIAYNPSLESVIKTYLKKRRTVLERLMGLSHFYFPMFEQALDNQNIPLEIKYLSIVESALKPRAKSRVGATGLWQFMYPTGKMYGLDVTSYVDERMDPIQSTIAACKYLDRLHKIFGDWDLALASYNSGPGNVTKAIRRSGGYTNYWNIRRHLPRETAGYLPAFLATMYIFEYADKHGLKPQRPQFNYIDTDTIVVKEKISLQQVSKYLNMSIEELQFLNPSYKLDIIPKNKTKKYALRLPIEQSGKFVANEEKIYEFAKAEFSKKEKPLPRAFKPRKKITYRVRKGDYLGKIAKRFRVRVSQIKKWNHLRSNRLRIGKRLTIYPKQKSTKTSRSTNSKAKISASSNSRYYTVKSGDTLWSISKKFKGVTIQNLKKWNHIRGSGIKPGMKLRVSKS